jgi:large subunit ribosomal protein L15
LGKGDLKAKINIQVNAFSKSAQQKVEAAGGKVTKI